MTVLIGSLGSGKTTVLKHLLTKSSSRLAVIVNELAAISIDLKQMRDPRSRIPMARSSEITGGCICCTRREAFLSEISSVAADASLDGLVIEAAGVAEPLHVAENFALVQDAVRLDTIVAVVDAVAAADALDALRILSTFQPAARANIIGKKSLTRPRKLFKPETKLMVEQIAYANVVLLCKCDQIDENIASELLVVFERLNPQATHHKCSHGSVPPTVALNTHKFSMQAAEDDDRWFSEVHKGTGEIERHLPVFRPPQLCVPCGSGAPWQSGYSLNYKSFSY